MSWLGRALNNMKYTYLYGDDKDAGEYSADIVFNHEASPMLKDMAARVIMKYGNTTDSRPIVEISISFNLIDENSFVLTFVSLDSKVIEPAEVIVKCYASRPQLAAMYLTECMLQHLKLNDMMMMVALLNKQSHDAGKAHVRQQISDIISGNFIERPNHLMDETD